MGSSKNNNGGKDGENGAADSSKPTPSSTESRSSEKMQSIENDMEEELVNRFPNLFYKSTPEQRSLWDDPEKMASVVDGIEEMYSLIASLGTAFVDKLDSDIQQLQEMPLSDQDQESVDGIAYSARDIRTSLQHGQRQINLMMPMIKSMTKVLSGDYMADLVDPSTSPADRATKTLSLLDELRSTSGLDENIADTGIPGLGPLMGQLDSFTATLREIQSASQVSKVPDLNACEEFRYQRLRNETSIRLLRFEDTPGDGGPNLIKLRVEEVDLNSRPLFNALSYVWGDHRPPLGQMHYSNRAQQYFRILCNGRVVTVTYNLFCCLRRLANAEEELLKGFRNTPLWIDQLCINQSDNAEKGVQVAMMDKIYISARMVVSWLGEKDSQTDAAVRLLETLRTVPRNQFRRPDFDVAGFVKEFSSDDWCALGAFLARPYFKRAWIVQEIALARRLVMVCGDRFVDWDDLVQTSVLLEESRAWTVLSQYSGVFRSKEQHMSSSGLRPSLRFGGQVSTLIKAQEAIKSDLVSLESLLLLGRQFDATQAVDKFFSMVGMARHRLQGSDLQKLPDVDYGRSLKEVALAFARWHIENSGGFSLLALVEDAAHRTQENKNFPSWLPDPSAPLLPVPLDMESLHAKSPRPWRACGDLASDEAPLVVGEWLCLQACKLDNISQVAVPFNTVSKTDEWFRIFDFLAGASGLQSKDVNLGDAVWRTLTTSPDPPGGKNPAKVNLDQEFGDWCISLITAVGYRIEKTADSITAQIMSEMSQLDAIKFDALAFGKDAAGILRSGEKPATDVLRSMEMSLDYWDKWDAESRTENNSELERKLKDSLDRIWQLNQDDVFPSPRRIQDTVALQHSPGRKVIQDSVERFKVALGMNLDSRRLFFTEDGRIGLGPQSLAEGDEIWAFAGASVPSVLRQTEPGVFRFIGEAFVLGAMHGEAVSGESRKLEMLLLK